jgi:hypothetical protein
MATWRLYKIAHLQALRSPECPLRDHAGHDRSWGALPAFEISSEINLQRSLIGDEYRPIRGRARPFLGLRYGQRDESALGSSHR